MRKIILAVGLALSLAACGDEPPAPTEGVISALPYGGESFWYSSDCGQWVTVPKTRTVTTGTGAKRRTRTESYTERKCVMNVQVAHRKAPWWQVCIIQPDRPQRDHCMNVAESTWRTLSVGGYYRIGD